MTIAPLVECDTSRLTPVQIPDGFANTQIAGHPDNLTLRSMPDKVCIFCQTSLSQVERAKEDVIPKWLLEHLGLDKRRDLIASSHLSDMGIPLQDPRIQGSHTILQGAICRPCNNGWMSDLETQAKPLITKMSMGEPFLLTADDCRVLGTWIFKTLALWNITSNYRHLVPEKDFEFLYKNRSVPAGRHVEIAFLSNEPASEFRTRMSPIKMLMIPSQFDKTDISRDVDRSSYILTMQLGKLLIQVVGLPSLGAWGRADDARRDILRIYPRIPKSLVWPPKVPFEGTIDVLHTQVALRLLFL
jgi:hypothetical protein